MMTGHALSCSRRHVIEHTNWIVACTNSIAQATGLATHTIVDNLSSTPLHPVLATVPSPARSARKGEQHGGHRANAG